MLVVAPPFDPPKQLIFVWLVTDTTGPAISFTNPLALVIQPLASVQL